MKYIIALILFWFDLDECYVTYNLRVIRYTDELRFNPGLHVIVQRPTATCVKENHLENCEQCGTDDHNSVRTETMIYLGINLCRIPNYVKVNCESYQYLDNFNDEHFECKNCDVCGIDNNYHLNYEKIGCASLQNTKCCGQGEMFVDKFGECKFKTDPPTVSNCSIGFDKPASDSYYAMSCRPCPPGYFRSDKNVEFCTKCSSLPENATLLKNCTTTSDIGFECPKPYILSKKENTSVCVILTHTLHLDQITNKKRRYTQKSKFSEIIIFVFIVCAAILCSIVLFYTIFCKFRLHRKKMTIEI